MKKIILDVPGNIRYISEWDGLEDLLPDEPFIMNKTITGCGYTEYCITNNKPTIICSPRKVLLENKEDQHSNDENVLYLKDEFSSFQSFDKDITKDLSEKAIKSEEDKEAKKKEAEEKAIEYTKYIKDKIEDHIQRCIFILKKPVKFLVTYDSFRRIKETLGERIKNYQIIVDEFQSIFCDARFKSDTENNFLYNLHDIKRVCYLSATPMIDKYLEELDEFKDLPYYELDWAKLNPSRVIKPILITKQCKSITEEAKRIISRYKDGKFESLALPDENGNISLIESREAVLYVNSVKNICDIIKKCGLTLDSTNVLCSDDIDNERKIRDAFRKVDSSVTTKTKCIGKVPKEGEHHKMFTLCTRTVYLGADFYSTNARSFIFSDANIDCLSVDITLDLPQILGRQRLTKNPWKNHAELYYKVNTKAISQEEFDKYLDKKKEKTFDALLSFESSPTPSSKHTLAETYLRDAKRSNYRYNFVSVDKHSGSDIKPVFNKLMMISEQRAFEIQQIDYKDRFSVFGALEGLGKVDINNLNDHLDKIYKLGTVDKYKYLCDLPENEAFIILQHLPTSFQNHYSILGVDRIRALGYNVTLMNQEIGIVISGQSIDIKGAILSCFSVGDRITKSSVKEQLKNLYDKLGYSKTPKAVDLGDYFIIKNCKIPRPDGKRDDGYEILAIKEGD